MMMNAKKTKGEQTRALILSTALRLFRERGYEETTMRAIAEEAGVALGNAYYYFRSKEDLVHEFYLRLQMEQFAAAEPVLLTEKAFKNRLVGTLRAQMGVISQHQRLFIGLFKIAADPTNRLNPFNEATQDIREKCVARFQQLVEGAQENLPADIKAELPYLLWMFNMAVVLFWIYDRSPNCIRTYRLIELACDLIANLVSIAGVPIMAPLRKNLISLLYRLREI
jgi:AcrR family transcriptional regulator